MPPRRGRPTRATRSVESIGGSVPEEGATGDAADVGQVPIVELMRQHGRLVDELIRERTSSRGLADGRNSWPLNRFIQLNPPLFSGTTDPLEADRWISDVKEMLTTFGCAEDQQVKFATFLFRGEAKQWWMATERLLPNREETGFVTWEEFAEAFNEKYFPDSVRTDMHRQFTRLEQGEMTVAQYEEKFNLLSRFAPEMVQTDRKRAKLFNGGLIVEIRRHVNMAGDLTYAQVVEKARVAERDWMEEVAKTQSRTPRRADFPDRQRSGGGHTQGGGSTAQRTRYHPYAGSASSGGAPSGQIKSAGPSRAPTQPGSGVSSVHAASSSEGGSFQPYPGSGTCFNCGLKGHLSRECPSPRNPICFNCGKTGHIRARCPLLQETSASPATPAASGASRVASTVSRGRGTTRAGPSPSGGGGAPGRIYAMTLQADEDREEEKTH